MCSKSRCIRNQVAPCSVTLFLKAERRAWMDGTALLTAALTKQNTRSRWASEVAYFINSPNSKVMIFFQWKFKTFCDTLLICNNNVIIIMEANQVFKMIWFSMFFDSTDKFTGPIVFVHLFKLCSQLKDQRRQKSWTKQSKSTKWKSKTDD